MKNNLHIHFKDGKPFGNIKPKPEKWPFLVKVANEADKATQIDQATDQARKNYERALKRWQSSSMNIKEPEFKNGDIVKRKYPNANGYMVGTAIQIKPNLLVCKNGSSIEGILKESATHYHEGQQIT